MEKNEIKQDYFKAIKKQLELECYEVGKYGKVKNNYRIIFCRDSNEYTVQLKCFDGWLCLHD